MGVTAPTDSSAADAATGAFECGPFRFGRQRPRWADRARRRRLRRRKQAQPSGRAAAGRHRRSSVSEDYPPEPRFTGRVEAIDKVDLRARVDGFLEKRLFDGGRGRQGGRPAVRDREGPLPGGGRRGARPASRRREASLKLADIEVERQTELVQKQTSAAGEARRGDRASRARRAATLLRAEGGAGEGAAASQLHRYPRADRRPHRPRQRLGRQFRRPVERRAGDDRQPGPDLRDLPGHPARDARRPQGAEQATGRAPMVVYLQLADGSRYAHPGKIDFLDVTVNQGTDTVQVRAVFPNPDRMLVDGQLVAVVAEVGKAEHGAAGAAAGAADRPGRAPSCWSSTTDNKVRGPPRRDRRAARRAASS